MGVSPPFFSLLLVTEDHLNRAVFWGESETHVVDESGLPAGPIPSMFCRFVKPCNMFTAASAEDWLCE